MNRTTFISLWFCFLALAVCANDPANVLVGDLIFERPDQWKWVAPTDGSAVVTRFVLTEESRERAGIEARFYVSDRKADRIIEGWKSYFPEPGDRAKAREERSKVNGRKVIWFTISGTYAYPKAPVRRDHLFVAVMISTGKDFVIARLGGPRDRAEKHLPTFQKMINDALAQAPGE